MTKSVLPARAVPADLPERVRLQVLTPITEPPDGLVKFGLAGKGLWRLLEPLRDGPSTRSGMVPVRPELIAGVKFFGRYRGGWIREGVLLSIG